MLSTGFEARRQAAGSVFNSATLSKCARVFCHPYQGDGGGRPTKASRSIGEWLSLVEHLVRDQGVGGSNPLSPTNQSIA